MAMYVAGMHITSAWFTEDIRRISIMEVRFATNEGPYRFESFILCHALVVQWKYHRLLTC